jgi:hypothetical protein
LLNRELVPVALPLVLARVSAGAAVSGVVLGAEPASALDWG